MLHTIRISRRVLGAAAAMMLLLSACGDDDDAATSDEVQDIVDDLLEDDTTDDDADDDAPADDTPADDTDEPADDTADEPADDTGDEPADDTGDDAPEPTVGVISESFVGHPSVGNAVDGEVKVYFNNGESGFIVAIYHGAGLADPTGLCPGNSLNTGGNDFSFISNAPTSEGACPSDIFTTDVGSVRVCTSGVLLYQTMIPNDSEGLLFGSLEAVGPDGTIVGNYGNAPNTPGTPVIDYAADSYTISATLTDDDTGSGSDTQTVVVNNVAPTLVLDPVLAINEDGELSLIHI